MEDPSVTAARLKETAKGVVDEARIIAKGAIADAADTDTYTAAKMVDSYMKMVDLAITGGLQATKDILGVDAPQDGSTQQSDDSAEGRRLVADAIEAIGRRMLRQASVVAQETADSLDKTPNGPTIWARASVKLADIALLGGIEMAETALIGPAPFEREPIESDTYPAAGTGRRKLRLTAPGLRRPGTADAIDDTQLRFRYRVDADDYSELTGGILQAGQGHFSIAVHPAGVISGLYVGSVEVFSVDDEGVETLLQTIDVELPL